MEHIQDTHIFAGSRMNLDAENRLLKPNETREVYNSLVDVPGSVGVIKKMKGFENVMTLPINSGFTMPNGTFKCIGFVSNIEDNTILYFLCETGGRNHSILQMNVPDKKLTWVLKSIQLLNFREDYKISASVVDGLLYWTDGYFNSYLNNDFNPPRKINIQKAINFTQGYDSRWVFTTVGEGEEVTGNPSYSGMTAYIGTTRPPYNTNNKVVAWCPNGDAPQYRYKPATGYGKVLTFGRLPSSYFVITDRPWVLPDTTPFAKPGYILNYSPDMYFGIDWQTIDRAKWSPHIAPRVSYDNDTTRSVNLLTSNLFQYAFRWVYDDNEKTTFSPVSELPIPTQRGTIDGSPYPDPTVDNRVNVWFDTGSLEVKRIEIVARINNIGSWFVIGNINKFDSENNVILTNDIYNVLYFYNDNVIVGIDQTEAERLYDAVPIVSSNMELIEKNRILDANYAEGVDNTEIDVTLKVKSVGVNVGSESLSLTTNVKRHATAFSTSPNDYFWVGVIDFSTIWFPGNIYTISISNKPNTYIDNRNLLNVPYPSEYLNKTIDGVITIDTLPTTTFANFVNDVCGRLRHSFLNSCVIAISPNSTAGYNVFSDYTSITKSVGGGHIVSGYEVGFIIEPTRGLGPGGTGEGCLTCSTIHTSISKTEPLNVFRSFKSGAIHPFCLFYKNRYSVMSFANISNDSKIYVPSETESYPLETLKQNSIQWEINHIPPPEATSYCWGYAKNTSKSYFIYAAISDMGVAGGYLYVNVNEYIVSANEAYPKFNVDSYKWESGDRIRFAFTMDNKIIPGRKTWKAFNENVDLEIMGDSFTSGDIYKKDQVNADVLDSDGNKVPDPAFNILYIPNFDYAGMGITKGSDGKYHTVVEIYRPEKKTDTLQYFQFGDWMPILNPHTTNRLHGSDGATDGIDQTANSPASGTFTDGDVYLFLRSMIEIFPCESFSYSDFYNSNAVSIGRPSVVFENSLFKKYISKILFSGKLIQNTRVNDLSRVNSSDSIELADKYGGINLIKEVGYSLKVLQEKKPTTIPISRVVFNQATGQNSVVGTSNSVLGEPIPHDSDHGTSHPTSYCKWENRGYFFDFGSHSILRDANNGIQNISNDYGIKLFIEQKCKLFGSASNVDVYSAFDESLGMVFFSFVDKTTSANSFTIGFRDSDGQNQDGFRSFFSFIPDFFGWAKYMFTSFKNNGLWVHNSDNVPLMNYYGQQYGQKIKIVSNKEVLKNKIFKSLKIHSNKVLDCANQGDIYVPPTDSYPRGMSSLLKSGAFTLIEGRYQAEFGKNMLTSGATPSMDDYINGEELRGESMELTLNDNTVEDSSVLSVEVNSIYSLKS